MKFFHCLKIENWKLKIVLGLILVSGFYILVSNKVANAAVDHGDKSFSFSASTTDSLKEITGDISLEQVAGTKNFLVRMWEATTNGFEVVDNWLAEKAGINLGGILRAIGSWFVIVLEWMLTGLKWLLGKF
ncbi:MAG: hypothetical protein COU11_01630 [Candidatus Harrisonbacteria bacterium CG10_big_fil_rev_8_21_14_0_10_49_15]|uniref:Uncharacterized protein n=1 Tax=Candidatus Harrisonbacteria bacterium CG10_big_fil_rev_8_21_14_0_10_49_15 TaxID=1974587 RepID=A0A2H0UNA5_9BACT|nr:MAG: hypothetical protein COU11_01630 [Candidatus Harrisonbacteria bacterium CG10_big_fil_rev_8_21_14_0_10_49_15]